MDLAELFGQFLAVGAGIVTNLAVIFALGQVQLAFSRIISESAETKAVPDVLTIVFVCLYSILLSIVLIYTATGGDPSLTYVFVVFLGGINVVLIFGVFRPAGVRGLTFLQLVLSHLGSALMIVLLLYLTDTVIPGRHNWLELATGLGRITFGGAVIAYIAKWSAIGGVDLLTNRTASGT